MLSCSFCNETDFDELGLEIHLANYCMGDQSPKSNSLAYREAAQQSFAADMANAICPHCGRLNKVHCGCNELA